MGIIPPTTENIQKAAELIRKHYYETSPSINPLQEMMGETPNPLKGKCYIASAVLYMVFDKEGMTLWRCEDTAIPSKKKNPQRYHWWVITDDGVRIDITEEQYSIEGRQSPATSDNPTIQKMDLLWYPSLADKVKSLTTKIKGQMLDYL